MKRTYLSRVLTLLTCALIIALAGCQSEPADTSLKPQHIKWEHVLSGCQGNSCPLINVDTLDFPSEPVLNTIIESRLLDLTKANSSDSAALSLHEYEESFFQKAQPNWKTYLQAKLIDQHDRLIIIELSSYRAIGEKHGFPGRGFINYDAQDHQALTLNDIVMPGKEEALWQAVDKSYDNWITKNSSDIDIKTYKKQWPFQPTKNIALTKRNVLLKYDIRTLAPFNKGHPSFTVPYSELKEIIRPEYLPDN